MNNIKKTLRNEILKRDNYECKKCLIKEKAVKI
jgi:hypothetical protein